MQIIEHLIHILPEKIRKKLFRSLYRSLRTSAAETYIKQKSYVSLGIFKGMKLPKNISHQNYTFSHFIGNYEQNIQQVIDDNISSYKRFIDIGCASGFFTVGVSHSYNIPSLGFDLDAKQIQFANDLAKLNDIENLSTHQAVSIDFDYTEIFKDGDFCLVDIEGAELPFFENLDKGATEQVTWLVELHQTPDLSVDQMKSKINSIMSITHSIVVIKDSMEINLNKMDDLEHIDRDDLFTLTNAQRQYHQEWLLIKPIKKL